MQERSPWPFNLSVAKVLVAFLLLPFPACRTSPSATPATDAVVRIGVTDIETSALVENLVVESLGRVADDGRVVPRLAQSWTLSDDALKLTIHLRKDLKFHDGSIVTADLVADTLTKGIRDSMGPAFADVASIRATSPDTVEIALTRPSPFVVEALDTPIRKPGPLAIGTGPFRSLPNATELVANDAYYMGAPTVDRVTLTEYPTARAAWAELLRNRIDMIYEVGVDALDSLESSTTVTLYPFTRRYQYLLLFNTAAASLKSAEVRRALAAAIDRKQFIQDALLGNGEVSNGPVWPRHWAARDLPTSTYDPRYAAGVFSRARLTIHCLVPSGTERLALVLQRQLHAVGVDMILEPRTPNAATDDVRKGQFEAFISPAISGPTLLRPYVWWHSAGSRNWGHYSNPEVDAAFDTIRNARSDDEYARGVASLQRGILADPPAVFLAWDVKARAVSKRLLVSAEPGVDIMGSLRTWQVSTLTARNGP